MQNARRLEGSTLMNLTHIFRLIALRCDAYAVVKEFERLGFPHDEVHEVQIAISHEK